VFSLTRQSQLLVILSSSIKITEDCWSLIKIKKRAYDHSCFADCERELLDSLVDLSALIASATKCESLRLRNSLFMSGQIGKVTSLLCAIASSRICLQIVVDHDFHSVTRPLVCGYLWSTDTVQSGSPPPGWSPLRCTKSLQFFKTYLTFTIKTLFSIKF
jgi:hypothetical protein